MVHCRRRTSEINSKKKIANKYKMTLKKTTKLFLSAITLLLLFNILHAFFLHQREHIPITITYKVTANFDTWTWISSKPKYNDKEQLSERIPLKKGISKNINTTVDHRHGVEFLGINWNYSDRGEFSIDEIKIASGDKLRNYENPSDIIAYSSHNTEVNSDSERIVVTAEISGNGWLMIDNSKVLDISAHKRFKPFSLWVNIVLFGFLLTALLFSESLILKAINGITSEDAFIVKLRTYFLYMWVFLIPFWIIISHVMLAVTMALMLIHLSMHRKDFDWSKLKLFIPLFLLFIGILTVDALFYQDTLGEDFGKYMYFLLCPFIFLGLTKKTLRNILKVALCSVLLYIVLLTTAIFERYIFVSETASFFQVFFGTIEPYWHTSYLAGFVLMPLFFLLKEGSSNVRLIIMSLLVLIFIYLSQARLPFITGAVILFYILSSHLNGKWKRITYGFVSVLVIGCVVLTLGNENFRKKVADTLFATKNEKVDSRVELWKESTEVAEENFLWGIGRKNIRPELTKRLSVSSGIKHRKYNTHNQYLEYQLSYGILIVVLFLICILLPLKIRLTNYTFFIVYFAVAILVESYFSRQAGIIFFGFYYSFFILYDQKSKISAPAAH